MYDTGSNRQIRPQPAIPLTKIDQDICDHTLLCTISCFLIAILYSVVEGCGSQGQGVAVPDVVCLHGEVVRKMSSDQNLHCTSVLGIIGSECRRAGTKQRACVSRNG